jgi:hypothetical protein
MFGTAQSDVKAMAWDGRKQRKEEEVCVFAFEHEVDAEKDSRKDVEEVFDPVRERAEKIAGGGGYRSLGLLSDGIDVQVLGDRKLI